MNGKLFALTLALSLPAIAHAQDASDIYELGELQITAKDRNGAALGGARIGGDTLQAFTKTTLDQALDLIPGAYGSTTGGSRNEKLIFVRGFDRLQTTLSVDGVRVYLPGDNRIDFGRYLTAEIAEVQVSKGYVSVIDGPGGLGGAINIVTRKPTEPFEARFEATTFLDSDYGQEAYSASGSMGGRWAGLYLQGSVAYSDRDHFTLSKDFVPTALEDGGARVFSATQDSRYNLKAGWAPNETDEYSLNWSKQDGEKNAPIHVTDTANTRFWTWPWWNLDSLSFLSRTKITDSLTLRTRLYANGFNNALVTYDSISQTAQTLPRSFWSYYDDKAKGGNVQFDWQVTGTNLLKAAFYVRDDEHRERQDGFIGVNGVNVAYAEPWQANREKTYSAALENTLAVGDAVDVIVGASYDWTDMEIAKEYNFFVTGTRPNQVLNQQPVTFPLRNDSAFNAQGAVSWRMSDAVRLHASVSGRTRFPTLMERYSSRMGASIPNPSITAERAVNYEVGGEYRSDRLTLTGAVFHSDVKDALILIPQIVTGFGQVNQTVNAGDGEYYGAEASIEVRASDAVTLGGNYTYLHRELDNTALLTPTSPPLPPLTGLPDHKAFAYIDWKTGPVTISPSIDAASGRWTSTVVAPVAYYKTKGYMLLNLAARWQVNEAIELAAGARNLTDKNYILTDGFPEAGRSFYASLRARF